MLWYKNLEELVEHLQDLIYNIRSDSLKDSWWGLEDISSNIIDNKLYLDEEYVDMNKWNKSLERFDGMENG